MRSRAWVLAGAIAGLVAGALLWRALTPGPPTGFPPSGAPWVTDGDRVAAMVSVHVHARWPEADFGGLVIPLSDAVRILRTDPGEAAASRRRRAIAKLASYGLPERRFGGEIEALGGDLGLIENWILSEFGSPPYPPPQVLEASIANLLVWLTPSCPWKDAEVSGSVKEPPPLQWSFEVDVPRPLPDVARALDPQSWAQCSPFFLESYLVETDAPCCPNTGSACGFTPDAGTGKPPAAAAVPRGKYHASSPFYEDFCYDPEGSCGECEQAGCTVDFENLLCVQSSYDVKPLFDFMAKLAGHYAVDFHLSRALSGELDDAEGDAYQLSADQGSLEVERLSSAEAAAKGGGDWCRVEAQKHLGFSSSGVEGAVGRVLVGLEDELAGQVAEHACCSVAHESWGPWAAILQGIQSPKKPLQQ